MTNATARTIDSKPLVMTSCAVHEVIEQIAQAKGKAKEILLAQHIDDPMMELVLKATYDPFVTYGIKQVPTSNVAGAESFSEDTFGLLDKLAKRELTGNAAKVAITDELNVLSEASQALLTRILKKDLRAGFTAGTCNRAKPGFIFVFECMLAHKFEEKRIKKWPVAAEPKYDGVRSLAIWDGQGTTFYSRTGKVFEGMTPIANAINRKFAAQGVPPMVLDGELMDKNNQFNKIVGDVHKKDFAADDAIFYIFDAMPLANFQNDSDERTYRERRMDLAGLAETTGLVTLPCVKVTPVRVMKSVKEIQDWAAEIMKAGGEGLIVKPLDGKYEKKRSYNWLKIKGEESVDAQVVGFMRGTGKYEQTLGALIIDVDGVEVQVSGMSDADRDEFWNNQELYRHQMIEVKYHEKLASGSLRHPRFIRVRMDKPVEDGTGC
jgi:DNA ligase-1